MVSLLGMPIPSWLLFDSVRAWIEVGKVSQYRTQVRENLKVQNSSWENQLFIDGNFEEENMQIQPFESRDINIAGKCIKTTPVFNAYWHLAAERQKIFFRKIHKTNDASNQLTSNPILAKYKFTNAYRASDRVSQYLIRNVIYRKDLPDDVENVFFRTLLFKLFNKIKTWEAIESAFDKITLDRCSFHEFDAFLSKRQDAGERNYSAAYVMPSAKDVSGHHRKHSNHLKLLEWMLERRFPIRLQQCSSMADGFNLFMNAPSLGPFLAYQFITDINYSSITDYSEQEFVVAGPGALDGISKCFVNSKSVPASDVIYHMVENQQKYFDELEIDFNDLWERELQLIDCQNLFCEISKYARVAFPNVRGVSGRTRIKQKYRSSGQFNTPWYPPKWDINDKISKMTHPFFFETSDNASAVQHTLF